jgi:putative RecB family exonuclease
VDQDADGELVVVDYKTGKAPELKYSDATNERILNDKFFQLKVRACVRASVVLACAAPRPQCMHTHVCLVVQVYALLLGVTKGRVPSKLKLIFLEGPTIMSMRIKPEELKGVEAEVRDLWASIVESAGQGEFAPKPGKICDWCSFKGICPAFRAPSIDGVAA